MLNKNERMEKLNNAGVNTGKFFTVDIPEGVKAGSKIHIIIDEKGNPVIRENNMNDVIIEQIIEDGYVRNTKLHRRFVMAQMFQALNYVSWDKKHEGYTAWLKSRGFGYSFNMMLEEVRVLGKLEERDRETFVERSHFFTKKVIATTMEDYIESLEKHIETLHTYKCKGIPYKKIKGRDIFVADVDKKILAPLRAEVSMVNYNTRSYDEIYRILKRFMNNMINLPWETDKSKAWVDAYKGAGAYYTLKNLVMYHGCGIENKFGQMCYGMTGVALLNAKREEYIGEGWKMFGLMKKVIKDNNFDFKKRMEEIYNK